jgi:putative hydrolase of the HAD superfamily
VGGPTIAVVLFDADGVTQTNPRGWLRDLKAFAPPGDGQAFVDDVFAAEQPTMVGSGDFRQVIAEAAGRWGLSERVEELLAQWRRIEVADATIDLVRQLRGSGVRCFLASNQQAFRASWMSEALGYDEVFDGEFYSCELGTQKPASSYFEQVLSVVRVPASTVVLVDDSEEYVARARDVGMAGVVWSVDRGIDALRSELAVLGLPT